MQPLEELPNYGVAGAVSSLLVVLALLLSWWYFKVLVSLHVTPWSRDALIAQNLSSLDGKDGFALDISWVLFSRRQTSAVSSPRLGGAAELLSTAVLGGVEPGVAAQLLRLPWDSCSPARKTRCF
jgi:hypothetical protein